MRHCGSRRQEVKRPSAVQKSVRPEQLAGIPPQTCWTHASPLGEENTMWIVKLALRRPYTFVVMALLIVVLGGAAIKRMRTDIFPEIDIPVITIIWTYRGMETEEVEKRITTFSEYGISS